MNELGGLENDFTSPSIQVVGDDIMNPLDANRQNYGTVLGSFKGSFKDMSALSIADEYRSQGSDKDEENEDEPAVEVMLDDG